MILETFPDTLHTHQHQIIHFQHKIKIIIFLPYFSCDFELDFHRKFDAFCSKNDTFFYTLARKSVFTTKSITFSGVNGALNGMKIKPKIF